MTEPAECLPEALQLPTTIVTRIAAGMSGAGVYRVDAGNEHFVLKITTPIEPVAAWKRTLHVQQAAAAAGIAPLIHHVDESRRAVLSALIVDRSFPAQLGSPVTRAAAVAALGEMLARLHALPIPRTAAAADPRCALGAIWHAFPAVFTVPAFVRTAVAQLLDELPRAGTETLVMSHNDVNPSNLVFDGERLMLLDWQTAAPNGEYYDLGAIAMFFRFDDDTSRQLIAAHDNELIDALPAAFNYSRRAAAVLSGTAALNAARLRGHVGGEAAVESTTSLGELYAQLRNGTLDIATTNGQWSFGLALVKESMTVR